MAEEDRCLPQCGERPEVQVATHTNGHTQRPSRTIIPFLFRQTVHPRSPDLHLEQPSLASGSGGSAKLMLLRLPQGTGWAGHGPSASGQAEAGRFIASALPLPFALPLPLPLPCPSAPVACTKMPAPSGAHVSRLHVGAPWPSETQDVFDLRVDTWCRAVGWMEISCGRVGRKCVSTRPARSASSSSSTGRAESLTTSASVRPATHPSGGNCYGGGSPPDSMSMLSRTNVLRYSAPSSC